MTEYVVSMAPQSKIEVHFAQIGHKNLRPYLWQSPHPVMDMPDSDWVYHTGSFIYLIKATSWGSGAWNRNGNEKELTIQRMIEIRSTKTINFISRLQEFNACPNWKTESTCVHGSE